MNQLPLKSNNPLIIAPLLILVGLVLGPILLVFLAIYYTAFFAARGTLYLMVWTLWCPRGRRVLYVYSDSTIWKGHVEANILPRLADTVVVINWSERRRWKISLATLLFHHFGGGSDFNPMALVFQPFRPRTQFRFFKPFQYWKKGNKGALESMEAQFMNLLTRMGQTRGEQTVTRTGP